MELRAKFTLGRNGAKNYYYYRADRLRKHGGIQTQPVGKDFLRSSVRAEDLDEAVVKELISLCHESRSSILVKNSLIAAEQVRKALIKDRADLWSQLTKLQRNMKAKQRKLVRAFNGVITELVQALNDEVAEIRLKTEVLTARIDEIDGTCASFDKVSEQVDETLGVIGLIEKLWKDEDYVGLRRAIGILVKEVDIRPEGAVLILRPLRVLEGVDIITREKAAPTGTLELELPRRMRRLAC